MMRAFLSLIFSCMFAACASAANLNLPAAAFWGGPTYWSKFGTTNGTPLQTPNWTWDSVWLASVVSSGEWANYKNVGINILLAPTGYMQPSFMAGSGMYLVPERVLHGQGSETIGYLVTDEPDVNFGNGSGPFSGMLYDPSSNYLGTSDRRQIGLTNNVSITAGSVALTATNANFTANSVQMSIIIPGAGPSGAALVSTIVDVVDSTHVNIATPASTTLSAVNEYLILGEYLGGNTSADTTVSSSGITITSGTNTLAVTGASFVSSGGSYNHVGAGDAGSFITVPGAGPSGGNLYTFIMKVTDGTHVILSDNAQTTVSGAAGTVYYGGDCGNHTNCGPSLSSTGALAQRKYVTWNGGAPIIVNGFGTFVNLLYDTPTASTFINAGQDTFQSDTYWYNQAAFMFADSGWSMGIHILGTPGAGLTAKQSRRAYNYGKILDWLYSVQSPPYSAPIMGVLEIGNGNVGPPPKQTGQVTNVTITANQFVLQTSASMFVPSDVGTGIRIQGAGPSGTSGGNYLLAHVTGYTSGTQVTIDTAATNTLTAQAEEVVKGWEWNTPFTVSIANGSKNLTVTGSAFTTTAATSSWITVAGAGPSGTPLVTIIDTITDDTHLVLHDAASTAVSGSTNLRWGYSPGTTGPEAAGAAMASMIHGASGLNWFPQQNSAVCPVGRDIIFNSDQCAWGDLGNIYTNTTGVNITAGQTALTDTAASFVSGDIGKTIVVAGAGFNGGPLLTTIATRTDSTHIGLTAPAVTTVSSGTTTRLGYGTSGLLWVWYINGVLQAFAPELNTSSYVWNFTPGCGTGPCADTMLKQGPDGNAYIFSMGYTYAGDPAGSLTFTLPLALCGNASATVLNEGRSLTVSNCQFTDPNYTHEYDAHIYQLNIANIKNIGWRRGPL